MSRTVPSVPYDLQTLQLPRILCLHGGGTNAAVFRIQCRVLESMLRSQFRLCYAEAPFLSAPHPAIVSVYHDMGPFKSWLRMNPKDENNALNSHDHADVLREANETARRIRDSLSSAMEADDSCGATGDWIGVFGFSQGAEMAGSVLLSQQLQPQGLKGWPLFRLGVLITGREPLVWLVDGVQVPLGLVHAAESIFVTFQDVPPVPTQNLLQAPNLHVHGLADPGLEMHRQMFHMACSPESGRVLEWEGDHRIPIKTTDATSLTEAISLLRDRSCVAKSS